MDRDTHAIHVQQTVHHSNWGTGVGNYICVWLCYTSIEIWSPDTDSQQCYSDFEKVNMVYSLFTLCIEHATC